ncbi:hypothetical protein Tola_0745 [Tolumonas auensis DSM 9187]|uniref:Mu-like prophage FluMu N-terminal domain-containing protein n=1 Tax=Tolumonas auensis (strain DSM 9187 / NBRC 110442 / TA 4) TaxID=595494 RepID=C4LBD8_TOLAT|nr:HI1506-related protein [Tolumonas auensis]ACQ92373.1 hypothetical protein Tola_0745 [Tolumonas auensis DSM 9187]
MSLFSVRLLNTAHDGYLRAKRCLVKGEQMVEVTAAELAQLEADPRITIISVSDVQPETADTCGDTSGDVVSELVSGSVTDAVQEPEPEPTDVEKPKKGGKR